jgi:hypothetical protein
VLGAIFSDPCDQSGAMVDAVAPDGPAASVGLSAATANVRCHGKLTPSGGDIITSIDGTPVTSSHDVGVALATKLAGERISVRYERQGLAHAAAPIALEPGLDYTAINRLCATRTSDAGFLAAVEQLVVPPADQQQVINWLGVVQAEANLDQRNQSGQSQIDSQAQSNLKSQEASVTLCSPAQSSQPEAGPLPTMVVGSWRGTEPSSIAFSGDGGNVMTGISWTSWTYTTATGAGASIVQTCIPDCATGPQRTVKTTITLSDVQSGIFTKLVEVRPGQTYHGTYQSPDWPGSASS